MIHYRSVLHYMALIIFLITLFITIPMALAWYYGESEALRAFIITACTEAGFGVLCLAIAIPEKDPVLKNKDSYLLVILTWTCATVFGALPFYLTGAFPSYISSFFETMSGFTANGATAMTDIESHPRSILFWRSMTNWIGGMGILVLFVAILPKVGLKGTSMVSAETAGLTKGKLTPKIHQTAFILWGIYLILSLLMTSLLLIGGVGLYDALNITFATMSAAGFSPKAASIGGYGSAYVEIIVTIFMMAAGTNFAIHYKILKGNAKECLKDSELRLYLTIIATFSLICAINLFVKGVYSTFPTSLRYAAFQVVSIISTSGFATADFNLWPAVSRTLLFLLFFVGGCTGSAGGGIKVQRVAILMRLATNNMRKRLHPSAISAIDPEHDLPSNDVVLGVGGFIAAYMATALAGTVIFSLSGQDMETCMAASLALLGNLGVGLGNVGPNGSYAVFSDALLAFGSFLMLAGRLELFTVYAVFSRDFWKK